MMKRKGKQLKKLMIFY